MNANETPPDLVHQRFMRRCIELATIAKRRGNTAVGSVIVIDGKIVLSADSALKKTLLTIAKFGISFGILAYLFHQAWQNDQFQVLAASQKNHGWLILALVFGVSASLVAFFRWYLFVRALDLQFHYRDAVRLGFLGHLLNLMSVGVLGGDALKSVFLIRQMKGHAAESIASVLFDRAIGMLAMFTMASVAYLLTNFTDEGLLHAQANRAFHFVCRFAVTATLAGYIGLGTIFFAPHFRRSKIYSALSRISRIGGLFKRLVAVVSAYRNRFGVALAGSLLLARSHGFRLLPRSDWRYLSQ